MSKPKLRHEIIAEKLKIKRYFFVEYITLFLFGFDCNAKEKIFYRPWLSFSTMLAISLIMVGMFHYSYVNFPDVEMVTDGLTPFVQSLLIVAKFIILFKRRREIVDLIDRIWKLIENASEAELKILSKENKRTTQLNISYACLVTITAIMGSAALPFIGFLFYIFKGEFKYIVLLTATYPLKLDNPLNYSITYVWTLYAIFAVSLVTTSVDTVFFWSTHSIAAQFHVLQHKLELLPMIKRQSNKDQVRKSIVDCVMFHQQTIELAKQLDQVFYPVAFTEVSIGSIQICLLVFQLGRNIDISRATFLMFFLAIELTRMLLYSYSGQHIEDESEKVAVTAFNSMEWKYWPISDCKLLFLVILRSQRPCKMTAVFFYLNMGLFISVIRTAGSYVTLLRSIGDV